METSTSGKTLDYNVKQTTISGNNNVNKNVDTSKVQSLNNTSSNEIESLDLSNEIEPKESKGLIDSIGDGLKAAGSWVLGGLKEIGSDLAETAANLGNNVESIVSQVGDWVDSNPITNKLADIYSTGAVITTSAVSGIAKLGEIASDGIEWVGGKVVEGEAWFAGQIAGLFSENAKNNIDNWRKDFSKSIKEDIARDKVGEINKIFYEDTELGRRINAHSAIKYDSEVAKKIQGVTTTAAEIAAATALTIATGGAAAPFVVGALVGAGRAAESTYQKNGTDTTLLQELGIAGSGVLTGLTWMAQGKLGQGAIEIGKDIISKGGATVLKNMGTQMLNKEFILGRLKDGLSLKNAAGKFNLNAIMNYGQAAMGTASSLTPYITGEEKFDATAALKIGGTFLGYLGLNVLEDTARDYVSGYKSAETIAEMANKIPTEAPVNAMDSADTTTPKGQELKDAEIKVETDNGLRVADEFDLQTIRNGAAVRESGLEIYSKGIDIDATSRQLPIDQLLKVASDPDYTAKVLDGDLLDEIDGMSRLEIGNALKDLKRAASKYNLDLGLDEASIARMDECIQKLSGNPVEVLTGLVNRMVDDLGSRRLTWSYYESEDGQKLLDYIKKIDSVKGEFYLDNGLLSHDIIFNYYSELTKAIKSNRIIPNEEQFQEAIKFSMIRMNNDEVRFYKSIMDTNGYHLYGDYETTFGEYIKRANLENAESETIRRLKEFFGIYATDKRVNSIYGSCEYKTSAEFANLEKDSSVMAYNNGEQSIMSLGYPEEIIRTNVNHESLHQISSSDVIFDNNKRVSISGVKYSVWDQDSGKWISKRTGFNECLTELFNRLSMGDDYPSDPTYCGYSDGTDRMEQLIDAGLLGIDELKKLFIQNGGEELTKLVSQRTMHLGLGDLSDTIMDLFDDAISHDNVKRTQSLNELTRIIKEISVATESGALQSQGKGFMNFFRKLFG